MRIKQLVIAASAVLLIFAIAFSVMTFLKNKQNIIAYDSNITVNMLDQNLVAKLNGSVWCEGKSVRIVVEHNGQQLNYIFFNLSETQWDELIINDAVYTEYIICPADKRAEQIDYVYYYTGDFTGIDAMNYAEIQSITKDAVYSGAM